MDRTRLTALPYFLYAKLNQPAAGYNVILTDRCKSCINPLCDKKANRNIFENAKVAYGYMIDLLLNSPSDQVLPSCLSSQEQGVVGMSRPPGAIPPPHPAGGVASGVGPNQGSGPPPGYVGNQQQAAMMKQMMALEQEKRVQMHMMEQQKQQLFREQRQQQQQQLLAEQVSHCVHSTRLCDDVVKKTAV